MVKKNNRLQIPINERICAVCGKNYTHIDKNGTTYWHYLNDKILCHSCYGKEYSNKKYNPRRPKGFNKKYDDRRTKEEIKIRNSKYGPKTRVKRITFRGIRHYVKIKPRTNQCQWCKKKVGDTYINCKGKEKIILKTHIHHINYHDTDIMKDTIELCISCHMYETWRLRKLKK